MKQILATMAISICCCYPVVFADTAADNARIDEKQNSAENDGGGDELICRKVKEIGSHMRKTVCHTRAQLDMARRESQELMRRGRVSEEQTGQ